MIQLTKEEAQQVLDALKSAIDDYNNYQDTDADKAWEASEILRARIAEPEKEQEPVAWRTFDGEGGYDYRDYELNEDYGHWWEERHPNHKNWVDPLYTAPPQREWQGLTDEEVQYLWKRTTPDDLMSGGFDFADAIEAKLKEKNT